MVIMRKGIILAGGSGTRLYPVTQAVSKQLMPVYDKPMIYYPLSVLMMGGIQEILIITTPEDSAAFQKLLGDGSHVGCQITYAVQPSPDGLAQAFIIGEEFIGKDKVALVLGDNIFYGSGLHKTLQENTNPEGGVVFAYHVNDPERYGVVEFDDSNVPMAIHEKPIHSPSNVAITGLYFLDNSASEKALTIQASARGELEITSVLSMYLEANNLKLKVLPRGTAWLDCGTSESLNDASNYIRVVEERQGLKVSCPEEIAWRNGWITTEALEALATSYGKSEYADYLHRILLY